MGRRAAPCTPWLAAPAVAGALVLAGCSGAAGDGMAGTDAPGGPSAGAAPTVPGTTPGTATAGVTGTAGPASPSDPSDPADPADPSDDLPDPLALSGTPGEPSVVATGLPVPWSVVALPDGSALVSLRDEARVVRVRADGTVSRVEATGPDGRVPGVVPRGEAGLLGLALSPGYADDRLVYAYLSAEDENRVVRMRLADGGEAGRLEEPELVIGGIPVAPTHDGGRIAFGPDGLLYVATGDARDRPAAQDPGSLAGKILRLTPDGAPAPGNPTEGSPVFSLGHRNVQGLGWDDRGRLWASEFGQDRQDELNLIEPGGNYGWPQVEGRGGGDRFVDPVAVWSTDEASPSGLLVTGDAVLMAALRGQRLWRVPLSGDGVGEPAAHLQGQGRLRDVAAAPGGAMWVLTNNTSRGDPRPGDDRLLRVPLG